MTDHFGEFLGIAILVIITPGQDTALTIRNTLLGGRVAGLATTAGVVAGQLSWAVATSAGVAALLAASGPAFTALRLAGIAYLFYLGAQAIRSAVRGAPTGPEPRRGRVSASAALRQGLLSNLSNPKMAAFFPSLLPQFVPPDDFLVSALGLGALFAAMTALWLGAYTVAVGRAGDLLRRSRPRRILEGLTGGVLIGLGLRLATDRR